MDQQSLSPIGSSTDDAVSFGVTGKRGMFPNQRLNGYIALADILEPEFLLPVQYNDLIRRRVIRDGETRLLLAVLKDGIRSYLKNMHGRTAQARRDFEETAFWFYAEDQVGIFAYEQICDALNIQPELLRGWLKSLHEDSRGPALRDPAPVGRSGGRARDFMKSRLVLA